MKVFDYTGGKKGALLGEIARPSFTGGRLRDNVFYDNKDRRYSFSFCAGRSGKDGKPIYIDVKAEFGVEAICFCLGEFRTGVSDAKWEWITLYTEEGFQEALKTGLVVETGRQVQSVLTFHVPYDIDHAGRKAIEDAIYLLHGPTSEISYETGAGTVTVVTQNYVEHSEINA